MIGSNGDRPYAYRQTHEDRATEKDSPLEYNLKFKNTYYKLS